MTDPFLQRNIECPILYLECDVIPSFSKPLKRQWIDFYLERIKGICLETIDTLKDPQSQEPLELIKVAINYLENKEQSENIKRIQEMENLKLNLKSMGVSSEA